MALQTFDIGGLLASQRPDYSGLANAVQNYYAGQKGAQEGRYRPQMLESEIAKNLAQAKKASSDELTPTGIIGEYLSYQQQRAKLEGDPEAQKSLDDRWQLYMDKERGLVDRRQQQIDYQAVNTLSSDQKETMLANIRNYTPGWSDVDRMKLINESNKSFNEIKQMWQQNNGKLPDANSILKGDTLENAVYERDGNNMPNKVGAEVSEQLSNGATESAAVEELDPNYIPTKSSIIDAQKLDAGSAGYDVVSKAVEKGLAHYPSSFAGFSFEQVWDQLANQKENEDKLAEYFAARALALEEASLQMNMSNLGTSSTLTEALVDKSFGNVTPVAAKMSESLLRKIKQNIRNTLHATSKAQSDSLKGIKPKNSSQASQKDYIADAMANKGGTQVSEEMITIRNPKNPGETRRISRAEYESSREKRK